MFWHVLPETFSYCLIHYFNNRVVHRFVHVHKKLCTIFSVQVSHFEAKYVSLLPTKYLVDRINR